MADSMMTFLTGFCGVSAGAGLAWFFHVTRFRARLRQQQIEADNLLAQAKTSVESITTEARLSAAAELQRIRDEGDHRWRIRQDELATLEGRLTSREQLINGQLEMTTRRQEDLRSNELALLALKDQLLSQQDSLAKLERERLEQLQKIAKLPASEARKLLLQEIERECQRDAAELSNRLMSEARTEAGQNARRIIAIAIQRYAGEQTFETTTATVALQGDDMKGRIIGREGRNIRAFEAATGVTVLIDDTPNAVVLSGFDPVRRAIAREAMQRLILDGRIHPVRIEEVVTKVSQEMEDSIAKAGEEAVSRTGISPLHPEIVKRLGRLRFRHSFTQNILDHSVEVARIAGLIAAELGIHIETAKRTGLLHDIGKAMDHEMEGSHAAVGAAFIKRYGESEEVINGVAAHHDEVPHTGIFGILAGAADAISASRPGARSETMTTYIKRLQSLEEIGKEFPGVDRCFAVQAGRELRVIVQPDALSDDQSQLLARNIARKIEEHLQYPGQIRVTVIRETRCIEFAK